MGGKSSKVVDTTNRPVVVIVGGGYAGVQLASKLDSEFFVILIDRKSFFSHHLAGLRASVEPKFGKQILIPYSQLLTNGVFIQGYVNQITNDQVTLTGFSIPIHYDYLVIATGASYHFPLRVPEVDYSAALERYQQFHDKLAAATSFLIIGGGPVGVELAGELATEFPAKSTTIVHEHEKLVFENLLPKFYQKTENRLASLNVKVIKSDRVLITEEMKNTLTQSNSLYIDRSQTYTTQKGKTITADIAIFCTGTSVNNSAIAASPTFSGLLTAKGDLPVDEYLRVQGFSNVFAIGDISNKERKMAFRARYQAEYLGKSFPLLIKNKTVKPYIPSADRTMVISIGRKAGAGQFEKYQLPNFILKGKYVDFFADQMWKLLHANRKAGFVTDTAEAIQQKTQKLVKVLKINAADATLLANGIPTPTTITDTHV